MPQTQPRIIHRCARHVRDGKAMRSNAQRSRRERKANIRRKGREQRKAKRVEVTEAGLLGWRMEGLAEPREERSAGFQSTFYCL